MDQRVVQFGYHVAGRDRLSGCDVDLGDGAGKRRHDGVAVLYNIGTRDTFAIAAHEGWHQFSGRHFKYRLPSWLDEGVALFIGRPWQLEDRSRLTWAMLREREMPLAELEGRFSRDRASASRAYAISGAFVHDLVRKRGADSAAAVLSGISLGLPFPEAFRRAIGVSLEQAEQYFWEYHSIWYRWVPILSSSMVIWVAITLLALVAFRRRRALDAAQIELWEHQERLENEARLSVTDELPPKPLN